MKQKFLNPNVRELLGVTPICTVTDRQIWTKLVSPMTQALLGPILDSKVELRETVAGEFPGDEVTNYNDHRMYGGKEGFVRNRYLVNTYRTQNGALIIKRDGTKFKVLGYFGDLKKGNAELIFKCGLRDRRYDGTTRAYDSALIDFPMYHDASNAPLLIDGQPITSVELSIYTFMPGSRTADVCGDKELEAFFENPFRFLDRPELFLKLFHQAWKTKRSPGMVSNPVPDVSKYVITGFDEIARSVGYDFIENTPSHYHVAMWSLADGYSFAKADQAKETLALAAGIKRLKANGVKLTRPQESWVCVLQSLRPDLIPEHLNLHGPKWLQDNISLESIWMYKPLSDNGRKILADAAAKAEAAKAEAAKAEAPKAAPTDASKTDSAKADAAKAEPVKDEDKSKKQ